MLCRMMLILALLGISCAATARQDFTDQPVRFVINTYWHGDHVGGNENFAQAGAVIIAHQMLVGSIYNSL